MRRTLFWLGLASVSLLASMSLLVHGIISQAGANEVRKAGVILVLGSKPERDGQPTSMLRGRVEHGVALYGQGWAPKLMFVGGSVDNTANQAEMMAALALGLGAPREAMVLEDKSRTTLEGAKFSREIMAREGLDSALVVTSGFHMARALRIHRDLGLLVYGAVAPHGEEGPPADRVGWWLREVGAAALYYMGMSP
ncbi:MAG: YdcF family protein [Chloroflexi bacterium]|nr:YdcF family protein [Chloroflexota bacterium]